MKIASSIILCLALLVSGCGLKDTVTSSLGITGELKLVNNTSSDARVERRKCGAEGWDEFAVVRAGKSRTWTLGEECYDLRALNSHGDRWGGTAIVVGGMRNTVWIEW